MMLQAIVEPVVLAFEADQHAGWLSMPRDENLLPAIVPKAFNADMDRPSPRRVYTRCGLALRCASVTV